MTWTKYDLNDRLPHLSELLKCIDMKSIPYSYFIEKIDSEDILQSSFQSNELIYFIHIV